MNGLLLQGKCLQSDFQLLMLLIFIASWAVAPLPLRTELKLTCCPLIGGFQSKAVQPRAAKAGKRRMMDIAKLNCLVHVKTGDLINYQIVNCEEEFNDSPLLYEIAVGILGFPDPEPTVREGYN